jgi:adenylyltransferase/sulfurtransferase
MPVKDPIPQSDNRKMFGEAELTQEEVLRYGRHLVLPEVGIAGQKKLKAAKVLVIGAGGLGSPVCLYLAAAGIGTIGIVDFDVVDVTNLQRQLLHSTNDVGRPKLHSARESINALNPHVHVETYEAKLTSANAPDIIRKYDIVIDGSDNFPTRYLVNDACVLFGKPNIYGTIFRFEGQLSLFDASLGPCYRCLYPAPPPPGLVPNCAEGGVLGVLPGIIGSLQALEAMKLILGRGDLMIGRLLLVDALGLTFRELKLRKDPACPVCGEHPTIHELIDYEQFCGITSSEPENDKEEITPRELKNKLDNGENLLILDVREPDEYELCNLHGVLIPLNELQQRINELDPEREIVVHCKTGRRSAKAAEILKRAGFHNVKNLTGGIMRWADEIDPSITKY